MEKEFVPYELALRLKNLGFDEPCLAFYRFGKDFYIKGQHKNTTLAPTIGPTAPTFSQAFRWFREKYNLRGFIGFRPNDKQFTHHVYDMSLSGKEYVKQRTMEEFNKDPKVGSYEEAELACLDKLIEIVESKQRINRIIKDVQDGK